MTQEKEFTEIINRYKKYIYTVSYMFSKDMDEIDDLYQEILINLWIGYKSFRGESKISTWIYRVSLNTCLHINRKKRRRPNSFTLAIDMNLFEDDDTDTKQIAQLYRRINKLGLFDKAIILLWLDNLCYEEIGAIMGITPGNVSVRIVRIKEQLKKM